MTYLIAGAAASALFVAAGWRSHRAVGATSCMLRTGLGTAYCAPGRCPAGQAIAAAHAGDDVAAAMYLALARLSSVIASQSVKIDVAVRPGLKVGIGAAALADTLEETSGGRAAGRSRQPHAAHRGGGREIASRSP